MAKATTKPAPTESKDSNTIPEQESVNTTAEEVTTEQTTNTSIAKAESNKLILDRENVAKDYLNISGFEQLPYVNKIEILSNLAKDPKTGLKSPSNAVLLYEKAKELRIGWANAISHMHFIKDKLGIDIHIIKAILSRPGSGVTWEKTEDYIPVFRYTDGDTVFENDLLLPAEAVIVNKLPSKNIIEDNPDKMYVVRIPSNTGTKEKPIWKLIPVDYRTTYVFTRKKKDIDDTWVTSKEIGRFSWLEALAAQLPIDSAGDLNPSSNWQKYRKLMISTRAFTFGAREIASDLLLGAYETSELFDMFGINYDAKDVIKD